MGHPIYLVPVQWTQLVILPLAAFGVGAAFVHWRDQTARLADWAGPPTASATVEQKRRASQGLARRFR